MGLERFVLVFEDKLVFKRIDPTSIDVIEEQYGASATCATATC
jgi:hypothetical protein